MRGHAIAAYLPVAGLLGIFGGAQGKPSMPSIRLTKSRHVRTTTAIST
jgi:hypothetical protein